jgi:hypothetical protein
MRVDRFRSASLRARWGGEIGETDYCISWIPVGGYVKIAGMVDESFDTDFAASEPQPWEFRAKPMWARMIVISAGVIMNVLLAICIFWGINFTHGRLIEETTEVGFVNGGTPAAAAGFRSGDKIVSVNGQQVTHWDEIQTLVYVENFGKDLTFTVDRNSTTERIDVPRSMVPDNADFRTGGSAHGCYDRASTRACPPKARLAGISSFRSMRFRWREIRRFRYHPLKREHPVNTWKREGELMSGTVTPNEWDLSVFLSEITTMGRRSSSITRS